MLKHNIIHVFAQLGLRELSLLRLANLHHWHQVLGRLVVTTGAYSARRW